MAKNDIEEEGADLDGLIEVEKDGESIYVNPLMLKDHENLGWKVVK